MRLEIARRSELALRVLRLLDDSGGQLRAAEIAEHVGSTPQYIPQIMNRLVKAGWVDSGTGPRGGYGLVADLKQRSVLELIEVMEGETNSGACVLRQGPCSGAAHCELHEAWAVARLALLERLSSVPVSVDRNAN